MGLQLQTPDPYFPLHSHVDKINCIYIAIVCSWDYFLLVNKHNLLGSLTSAVLQDKKSVAYHFIFVSSQPLGIPQCCELHQLLQLLLLSLQESGRLLIFVAISISQELDRLFTSTCFAVVQSVFFHSVHIIKCLIMYTLCIHSLYYIHKYSRSEHTLKIHGAHLFSRVGWMWVTNSALFVLSTRWRDSCSVVSWEQRRCWNVMGIIFIKRCRHHASECQIFHHLSSASTNKIQTQLISL